MLPDLKGELRLWMKRMIRGCTLVALDMRLLKYRSLSRGGGVLLAGQEYARAGVPI